MYFMNPYLITSAHGDHSRTKTPISTYKTLNNQLLGWAYYAPPDVLEYLKPAMEEWFSNYINENFTERERIKYNRIWYSDGRNLRMINYPDVDGHHQELIDDQAKFTYEYYQWCKATIAREFPSVYLAMVSRWEKIDQLTGKAYMHWPSYDIWDENYNIQLNQQHLQHKSLDKFIPGRLLWRGQIQGPNTWGHLQKYYEQDEKNNLSLWRLLWKSQDSMVSRFGKKIWSMSPDSRKQWKPEFYKAEDLKNLAKLEEEKKKKGKRQAMALLQEYEDCRH